MGAEVKGTRVPALPSAPRLVTALNQSVQVRDKVEECVQDLSLITGVLTQEVAERVSLDVVEQALHHSEEVEIKVQECADDLSFVNETLSEEIRERKKLESKFAEIKGELADAQSDLSDSLTKEQHARHLSLHDALTGLPNRNLFSDRLENALALAKRHTWRLAVMFIDLDKFKSVNDTHGHQAGDQVLKIVAERLEAAVRGADTVGRRGGDEFLYLMLEVREDVDVGHAARKILEAVARPCEVDGLSLTVRPSIGIALYPEDGTSASELMANADSAMYRAKQRVSGYWFHKLRS